jgi:uncharacterized protein
VNAYHRWFALVWFVGAGVGCTSVPVHYYTLTPPPDKRLRAAEATLAIDVRVVHVPPQLNRSELMVRTGATEATLLENERWASPMKDEIQDAVRLGLQRRLGGTAGLSASLTKLALDIDVRRLEAELGRYALLEVSWSASLSGAGLPPRGARVTTTCTFRADEEIGGGYAAMVEGYQREIAALADAIAVVLTSSASGIDVPCQKSTGGAAAGAGSKDH